VGTAGRYCHGYAVRGKKVVFRVTLILNVTEIMGSRLSRQNSLDNDNFSRKRRKHLDSTGESDRSGDFLFTSLMLRSDKLPGVLRRANHSPYVRRVAWVREIQKLLQERKIEDATDVLKLLRKVSAKSSSA